MLTTVLFFLAVGVLKTGYFHFEAQATGSSRPLLDTLLSELTGAAAAGMAFFLIVLPFSRRWPLRGPRWRRHLAVHVVGLAAYSGLKTTLMWAQRVPLWSLFGMGRYDYGGLSARIPMEASGDVVVYAFLAAALHAWFGWQELQERRLREAQLQARLGEARLAALEAQLEPHFLFNTLNAISAVMYRDPRTADRLLSRLSNLLRSSLARDRPEVSVAEELELLEGYLEIERARFGEKLVVNVAAEPEARGGSVPRLILQPLVENAIRHTVRVRESGGSVQVRITRADGRLRLRVDDDGTGFDGDPEQAVGSGVGLANTRERLAQLHGAEARLTLGRAPGGGARVEIELPFREAPVTSEAK